MFISIQKEDDYIRIMPQVAFQNVISKKPPWLLSYISSDGKSNIDCVSLSSSVVQDFLWLHGL